MTSLTAKRQAFLELMKSSDEHARRGFELLVQRSDLISWFEPLEGSGFFAAQTVPRPVSDDNGKTFRIPLWPPLTYLEACSRKAGQDVNMSLAEKIMAVVRSVTHALAESNAKQNYYTYWSFAKIVGQLPLAAVSHHDTDLVTVWLRDVYGRGMVISELDKGFVKRCLASEDREHWPKARTAIWHCTELDWDGTSPRRQSASEDYWVHELVKHHAVTLGAKTGLSGVQIFHTRLHQLAQEPSIANYSWLSRPAIEEHPQNHSWERVENALIEGFRDSLHSWISSDVMSARPFVSELLTDGNELCRRIAIHVINETWPSLSEAFFQCLTPDLFRSGHRHELYRLLESRFDFFTQAQKSATFEVIESIPADENARDSDLARKREQRIWLSSIAGRGFEAADEYHARLQADPQIGLPEHPSFLSYMETSWGPGKTPFSPEELIGFALAGSIVERLNGFTPTSDFRAPNRRALTDALEHAVVSRSDIFLPIIESFQTAQRPYQYAVINGFKRLWDEGKPVNDFSWDVAWSSLLEFFTKLLNDEHFWTERVEEDEHLTPTRDWIPSLIASFLQAGTRSDERAYPPSLLPIGWELIQVLLRRLDSDQEVDDDAMFHAINSPRGKALEALFSHALRTCRFADKSIAKHAQEWIQLAPVFDAELNGCNDRNFEFSTLVAASVANVEYLSDTWYAANFGRIFATEFPRNFQCAIEGLAYAPATRSIYTKLKENNVLERALRDQLRGKYGRERLIERIALAYLWGEEELASPVFQMLFDEDSPTDLEVATRFFGGVPSQDLAEDQRARIRAFLTEAVAWSKAKKVLSSDFLSGLSRLVRHIDTLGADEVSLLRYLAPHVQTDFNLFEFVEELRRFVRQNPAEVAAIFSETLKGRQPVYDFEDKVLNFVKEVAAQGERGLALEVADLVRYLPGIRELSNQLVS